MFKNFKVGDRVILTSNEFTPCNINPYWWDDNGSKIIGTVYSVFTDEVYQIKVSWDNGDWNEYKYEHLSIYQPPWDISLDDELFNMEKL